MLTNQDTKNILLKIADMFIEKEDELSGYDAVIGDGDHGITMARGARYAKEKILALEEGSSRDYYKLYGRTLISTLGGAMGPLFGSVFLELSKAAIDKESMTIDDFYNGFKHAMEKVMDLGGAKPLDKTMVDSMYVVVNSLKESTDQSLDMKVGFEKAFQAGLEGIEITKPLIAKRGRSRYLQEKAIGHQDAGATSFTYMIEVINSYVQNKGV